MHNEAGWTWLCLIVCVTWLTFHPSHELHLRNWGRLLELLPRMCKTVPTDNDLKKRSWFCFPGRKKARSSWLQACGMFVLRLWLLKFPGGSFIYTFRTPLGLNTISRRINTTQLLHSTGLWGVWLCEVYWKFTRFEWDSETIRTVTQTVFSYSYGRLTMWTMYTPCTQEEVHPKGHAVHFTMQLIHMHTV